MKPRRDLEAEQKVIDLILDGQSRTGKKFVEIADELGYANPNFLTNIKKRVSRVPLAKAVAMAKTLDIDPHLFCKTCLSAYMPELEDFVDYAAGNAHSKKEKKVIAMMRSVDSRATFGPRNKAQWDELRALMQDWV